MMPVARRKVLVVEDEEAIAVPLGEALDREGFDITVTASAVESLKLVRRTKTDLVLLDLMLPDGSGFDLCRELRRESEVPIIMLTARERSPSGSSVSSSEPTTTWSSPSALARW